jgi:peptide deformylase
MILPIFLYGQAVLRRKSEDVPQDYIGLNLLIDNMFETMHKAEGVGLAAPQVGVNINLFVIDTASFDDKDEPDLKNFKRVFINPKFSANTDEKISSEEGCLSVPGIHENVQRFTDITVEYLNENFEPITEILTRTKAKVFQHEFDHLQGIIYTDKINVLRKKMISNRLNSITKGKSKQSYKVKY